MASLTDSLPLNDLQTMPVRDHPANSNAGLATALNALSSGLNGFADFTRQQAAQKRQDAETARQAKADAYTEGERSAALATQVAAANVRETPATPAVIANFTDNKAPNPVDGDLAGFQQVFDGNVNDTSDGTANDDISRAGKKVLNVQQAVVQGAMPGISLQASATREYLSLLSRFPDHSEKILDTWKKLGIDVPIVRQMQDEQAKHTAERTSEQKLEDDAFTAGAGDYGPAVATMSREDVIAHGLQVIKDNNALEIEGKRNEIASRNLSMSQSQRTQDESDANQRLTQMTVVNAHNAWAPQHARLQQAMIAIQRLPVGEQAAEFAKLGPAVNQMIETYTSTAIARAVAAGYKGDTAALRSALDKDVGSVRSMFSGDMSMASGNLQAFNQLQLGLKTTVAKALPVYSALQAAGLSSAVIQSVSDGLAGNKPISDALRAELNGMTTDFGEVKGSTHLMNVVRLLKGQLSISDVDPMQAGSTLHTVVGSLVGPNGLVPRFNRGENVSPDLILNGLGTAITATRTLTPTSQLSSLASATAAIANDQTRKALHEMLTNPNSDPSGTAHAVAIASRAGSAQILEIIRSKAGAKEGSNAFWSMHYDRASGKYTAQFDQGAYRQAVADAEKDRDTSPGYNEHGLHVGGFAHIPSKAQPEALAQMVRMGNINLNNIMDFAKYDPSTPKGTPLELRSYYAMDVMPKSMQNGGSALNPNNEVGKILTSIQHDLDQTPNMNQQVSLPKEDQWRAAHPELTGVADQVAAKFGIPPRLLVNLIGRESSFNPNAPHRTITNPKSMHYGDAAVGLGAMMPKTAEEMGVSREELHRLTPAAQIELTARYLKKLKDRTGEPWEDILSRYISGRPLSTGAHASDGGTTAAAYVQSILG